MLLPPRRWVVSKFGARSFSEEAGLDAVERAIRLGLEQGYRVMAVCEAVPGVPEKIEAAIGRAEDGQSADAELAWIGATHERLCAELGMPTPPSVASALGELRDGLAGLARMAACDPGSRARMLSHATSMSSGLVAARLDARGLRPALLDARALLHAPHAGDSGEGKRFLAAKAVPIADPACLQGCAARVAVTQGGTASDRDGNTVLLGRCAADASAALLGVLLGAARVEIWSEHPGLFTIDPTLRASARMIERLSYAEAEAMAQLGSDLHPGCVAPLRATRIPLLVRGLHRPDLTTHIDGYLPPAGVRAVTRKADQILIRIGRSSRGPAGADFVREVARCLFRHTSMADLVGSPPDSLDVLLDQEVVSTPAMDELLTELGLLGHSTVVRPVASVSLVGTQVRTRTSLAAALAAAADIRVHERLRSATDTSLTVLVDDGRSAELAGLLHRAVFESGADVQGLGPAWDALHAWS